MLFKLFRNELVKDFLCVWGYKINWIGEFVTLALFFLFLSNISHESKNKGIEYCIWFYSVLISGEIGNRIASEMKSGTLEQVYLSVFSSRTLFFIKIISSAAKSMFIVFFFLFLMFIFGYIDIDCISFFYFILSLCVLTPVLFGISFIFGGLTLIFRDISWLTNLFNNSLMFFSCIFLQLNQIPGWMHVFVYNNVVYVGIQIFNEQKVGFHLIWLSICYFVMFFLGLRFFIECQRKAKSNGTLGYY